ncbi:MAG: Rrf2 family transcriptional regulator [Elusimicrobia bacterium]|nr:Rrf2 family transcriptional regulator [Elusimicrobiota bacterium]
MRMNRTLAYGLSCLHYLGQNNGGQWNQVAEIARFQGLPAPYCNKVLQALVHAGFVESQKGKGYRLRKDLDGISVWQLMEAFTFNGAPKAEKAQVSNKLYETLRAEVNHWLVGLTVQDIVEMMKEEERRAREVTAED